MTTTDVLRTRTVKIALNYLRSPNTVLKGDDDDDDDERMNFNVA